MMKEENNADCLCRRTGLVWCRVDLGGRGKPQDHCSGAGSRPGSRGGALTAVCVRAANARPPRLRETLAGPPCCPPPSAHRHVRRALINVGESVSELSNTSN